MIYRSYILCVLCVSAVKIPGAGWRVVRGVLYCCGVHRRDQGRRTGRAYAVVDRGFRMSTSPPSESPSRWSRLGLNPWLQGFLTIIAGTAVAVIAWTIIERFLHIIILVLAAFLLAFLFGPLIDRLERRGLPRILAILLIYLVVLGGLVLGGVLLINPLTAQLQGVVDKLPTLV